MHERRYARYGGWRRYPNCEKSRFGFGGRGYGGFGNQGMYGGYRSHYNYDGAQSPIYRNDNLPTVNSQFIIPKKFSLGAKMTFKWLLILILITLSFVAFSE